MQNKVIGLSKKNKKGIALETLAYWIIGVAVLVIMVIGYIVLTKKGEGGLSMIDRLLRKPATAILSLMWR